MFFLFLFCFFFFFCFVGRKTFQARISVKHTKLVTISINTATKPIAHKTPTCCIQQNNKREFQRNIKLEFSQTCHNFNQYL